MRARLTGRAASTYALRVSRTFLAISGTPGHRLILQDSPAKSGTVGKYDIGHYSGPKGRWMYAPTEALYNRVH